MGWVALESMLATEKAGSKLDQNVEGLDRKKSGWVMEVVENF